MRVPRRSKVARKESINKVPSKPSASASVTTSRMSLRRCNTTGNFAIRVSTFSAVNISDTTDYYAAEYLGQMGEHVYRIHNGEEVDWRRAVVPTPPVDRQLAAGIAPEDVEAPEDLPEDALEGCGCETGGGPAPSALLLLGLLGARRRRS